MAFLKDLIVTGASQFLDGITVSKIIAPISSDGTSYGAGTNGQVLLSNGSNIYWGSAAPTVTESTVSGWGFTKNGGTVTNVSATGTNGISISGSPITSSGSITIGLNLSTAINNLGEGTSPANREDYAVVQYAGGGTATTSYYRRKLKNVFAALNNSDITTALGHQEANMVLAGPASGNATATAFRKLVSADIDGLDISALNNDAGYITNADVPEGASAYTSTIQPVGTSASNGTSNGFARGDHVHNITKATIDSVLGTGNGTAKFYREDGTWQTALTSHQTIKQDGVTGATVTRYATCSTAAGTKEKTATITSGTFSLETGAVVIVKFTNSNTVASPTLNINSTGAKAIMRYGTTAASTNANTSWYAGTAVTFVYDGTNWLMTDFALKGNDNTIPSAYCSTAAATAAKAASCSGYALLANSYIQVIVTNSNTSSTALTLNINGKGAKSIYINGSASSDSNHTLPAGSYLVYYDGTNYYFRTDGKLTANITGSADLAVSKSGDTMTGDLNITKTSPEILVTDSGSGASLYFGVGAGQINHGIYSYGYSPTKTTFTEDAKWMIYRNKDGDIILNGKADSAVEDSSGNVIADTYVQKAGDLMSGNLNFSTDVVKGTQPSDNTGRQINFFESSGTGAKNRIGLLYSYIDDDNISHNNLYAYGNISNNSSSRAFFGVGYDTANSIKRTYTDAKVYGAVYNDYAEYRETEEEIEPGRVITEVGNGKLILATERLMRGCEVVSDTFGFAIGESKKCKTPTAVSGRVLVYPYENLEEFKSHIGWPVCSGPNGTVSIMTEEEEKLYPSRIIGTISEVPDYDIWYCGQEDEPEQREVKGRIWIRVR